MARIEVEIDSGNLDFDELVSAINQKIGEYNISTLSKRQIDFTIKNHKKDLQKIIRFLYHHVGGITKMEGENLSDHFYNEFIEEIKSKYTEEQLRKIIENHETRSHQWEVKK